MVGRGEGQSEERRATNTIQVSLLLALYKNGFQKLEGAMADLFVYFSAPLPNCNLGFCRWREISSRFSFVHHVLVSFVTFCFLLSSNLLKSYEPPANIV